MTKLGHDNTKAFSNIISMKKHFIKTELYIFNLLDKTCRKLRNCFYIKARKLYKRRQGNRRLLYGHKMIHWAWSEFSNEQTNYRNVIYSANTFWRLYYPNNIMGYNWLQQNLVKWSKHCDKSGYNKQIRLLSQPIKIVCWEVWKDD